MHVGDEHGQMFTIYSHQGNAKESKNKIPSPVRKKLCFYIVYLLSHGTILFIAICFSISFVKRRDNLKFKILVLIYSNFQVTKVTIVEDKEKYKFVTIGMTKYSNRVS